MTGRHGGGALSSAMKHCRPDDVAQRADRDQGLVTLGKERHDLLTRH
jgi:hypothetical protein